MNRGIFITGTDTEVGKTIITGLFGRFLLENGLRVVTQKWVQTGKRGFSEDIGTHQKIMGIKREKNEKYLIDTMPYTFELPASPHLAARMENTEINPQRIMTAFHRLQEAFDFVVVEGTGGALVPINDCELVVDIAGQLSLPVIIVAENKLGAINHTLLTVEALKKRNIKVLGVIFNRISKTQNEIILKDNMQIVEKLSGAKVLGELIYAANEETLYNMFIPIAKQISSKISQSHLVGATNPIAPRRCDEPNRTS